MVTEVRWLLPEGDLSPNGKPPPDFSLSSYFPMIDKYLTLFYYVTLII
jgi:hypothetical protein